MSPSSSSESPTKSTTATEVYPTLTRQVYHGMVKAGSMVEGIIGPISHPLARLASQPRYILREKSEILKHTESRSSRSRRDIYWPSRFNLLGRLLSQKASRFHIRYYEIKCQPIPGFVPVSLCITLCLTTPRCSNMSRKMTGMVWKRYSLKEVPLSTIAMIREGRP